MNTTATFTIRNSSTANTIRTALNGSLWAAQQLNTDAIAEGRMDDHATHLDYIRRIESTMNNIRANYDTVVQALNDSLATAASNLAEANATGNEQDAKNAIAYAARILSAFDEINA